MPLVAAIPAFLGTAAGAATAISTAAGIGGSLIAAGAQNKATNQQIAAQQAATQQQLALQQQQYDQTRQDFQPFRETGYAANDALSDRFGFGGAAAGQPDYMAYGQANPDVLAWAQSGGGDPTKGADQSLEDRLAYHYQNSGRAEGRELPVSTGQQGQTAEQQLQQTIGAEPEYGQRKQFERPAYINPDVSLNAFKVDPGYQFRLDQGNRQISANSYARGVGASGEAGKAFIDYGQNMASQEYDKFFGRQVGLTSDLNAYNQNSFSEDRRFDTGVYDADRNFAAGRYDTNRSYATGRADQTTNDLFRLQGVGAGATGRTSQAGSQYAANAGNAYQSQANNLSDAYGQQANNTTNLASNVVGYGQSLLNAFMKPRSTSGTPPISPVGYRPGYAPGNGYSGPPL